MLQKPSARMELDSKFEDLKRQINATPNATEEEKQDAIQRLNVKREEVKNLINQDRRDNDVEQHKNTGLQELETIHANPTRKSDALQELQTKFISQTELINNNKDATNEEKDEAKRLLEISKNKTITNINQAQTNNQVDNAKDNGMNEIATIIPATTIKTDAKTAIDKKLSNKLQSSMVIMMQQMKKKQRLESWLKKRKLKSNLILQIVILKGKSIVLKLMG